jgi:hypothetical protein
MASTVAAAPPPMVSGEPIPVATGSLRGRLAVGLSTTAVGVVNVGGGKEPGIFATANSHSVRPGLFLYRYVDRAPTGAPVFGDPVEVTLPAGRGKVPPPGAIFQAPDGTIHGFWLKDSEIVRTRFDADQVKFIASSSGNIKVDGLPQHPGWIAVVQQPDGTLDVLLGISDGTPQRPTDTKTWRDSAYRPFDGAGVYRGGWPFVFMYGARLDGVNASAARDVRLVSPTEREALLNFGNMTPVDLGSGRERDVITGSWFGNLLYYHNTDTSAIRLERRRFAVDAAGIALRSATIRPSPIAYPNRDTGKLSDLIVGGEGALDYYRFTGAFSASGAPVYALPVPVLEQSARLYPGSLPVLSAVDWDGDGAKDIIAGNSEGRILLFRNRGGNDAPAFEDGVELEAAGRVIHIQQGYNGVQGPQEARWGYVSPTVVDWNGDGLPDIVASSATARHEVFLNIGTRKEPRLDEARPLYCHGLDLHGTWRVQPGAGFLGERMAYVALDDDDEFHLYWQIDPFNLEDGGKLRLEDGTTIRANFLAAGGTGRSKISIVDWDRDGKTDLLVGTPRHGSIPNPERGLPQSKGLKGAAVVFLKNVGTNDAPVYKFPTMVQFKGDPIYHGQHECGPAVWDVGQPDGPDLLVGSQDGRIYFYARKDLTWAPLE